MRSSGRSEGPFLKDTFGCRKTARLKRLHTVALGVQAVSDKKGICLVMDKFIVLAAHRSGNTLLLSSLNSHSQIECHKRVFNVKTIVKRLWRVDRPNSPFSGLT